MWEGKVLLSRNKWTPLNGSTFPPPVQIFGSFFEIFGPPVCKRYFWGRVRVRSTVRLRVMVGFSRVKILPKGSKYYLILLDTTIRELVSRL